jgi:hypothetical protein
MTNETPIPEQEEFEPIEVRSIGTVLETDEAGYLISESSIENIREPWLSAAKALVAGYQEHLGNSLDSIYIRGSVARGTGIEGVSDLDAIILIKGEVANVDLSWKQNFLRDLKTAYPFCNGFDADATSLEEVMAGQHPITSFNIKILGAHAFGEDIRPLLPPMRPEDGASVTKWFDQEHLENKIAHLRETPQEKLNVKTECKWLAKHILRVGYELVMQRDQSYTRDLYTSWEIFSKYYPEKSAEMRQVLELAINHTEDRERVLAMLEGIGQWVVKKATEERTES